MTGRGYKHTYTHSVYHSRGAMIRRDKVWEGVKSRGCFICGKTLDRKITIKGNPEGIYQWLRRKTCGYERDEFNKLKKTECLLAYQSGELNGNYKGLMDRKCRLCGKKGLSYVCKDKKLTELCFKCYAENRPPAYNKREDEIYPCTACGKDVVSRFKNTGHFRYKKNGKIFCSKHCANITRDRKRIPITCIVCGKIKFLVPYRAKNRRTCGLICNGKLGGDKRKIWFSKEENKKLFQEAQKARRQGKYCNCKLCGKEFYLYPSTRNTGKWCSKECELEGSRKWVNCIQCTDEFQVRNSEIKKIRRCENCRNNKSNLIKI